MIAEILENTLTVHGLRWVHVVQMSAPVEAGPWLERIPRYSRPLAETQRQHEPGLDLYHLRLWWQARELVTMQGLPDRLAGGQGLLWAVDKKQTLREAVVYAGVAYMDLVGRWPGVALVQSLPQGATATVVVYEDPEERVTARLAELPALPRGFLLLCDEEA